MYLIIPILLSNNPSKIYLRKIKHKIYGKLSMDIISLLYSIHSFIFYLIYLLFLNVTISESLDKQYTSITNYTLSVSLGYSIWILVIQLNKYISSGIYIILPVLINIYANIIFLSPFGQYYAMLFFSYEISKNIYWFYQNM